MDFWKPNREKPVKEIRKSLEGNPTWGLSQNPSGKTKPQPHPMKKTILFIFALGFLLPILHAQEAKDYQQLVSECIGNSDYKKAEQYMLEWIDSKDPSNDQLYILFTNLGTIQRRQGKSEAALQSYNHALELQPRSVEVLSNRASLKSVMKDYAGSLEDYNLALALEVNEKLLMNRAHVHKILGDTTLAEKDLLHALEINPDNFMTLTNLMNIKVGRKQYQEAMQFYDKSISEHPGEPILFNNRADLFLKMKEFDKALVDVNRAIDLEKEYDNAYVTRAEIYIALGDRKKGLKDLQKAIKLGNDTEYVMELVDECNRYTK
ncbi:MAG: tetratricopeptide repeat protein [Bacteroidales bacterium]